MEHLTLIGRYYERLENKDYADILELKINNFEDLSQYSFSYLNDSTFYDVTYEILLKTTYASANIHSISFLRSDSIKILYRSLVLNNSSLLENNIINRKASVVNVTNNSNSKAKSLKIKTTNANIRCINSLNSITNKRLHINSDIYNTSNISLYVHIYAKRVRRKYFTLEINKSHVIEVILWSNIKNV